MSPRHVFALLSVFLSSGVAFVGVGMFPTRSSSSSRGTLGRRTTNIRPRDACANGAPKRWRHVGGQCLAAAAEGVTDGDGEGEGGDDEVDLEAEGVAKMRASEIKAELDVRGVTYAGIFEKAELVEKLIEARSLGMADPSIIDDLNKENLERKMDPEKAAAFAEDLVDQDKLKDLTAADGTLPGGLTPDQLSKLVANPEIMVLMQNSKMQEVMKKVMSGGPEAMESMQNDPETRELLGRLNKAMSSVTMD